MNNKKTIGMLVLAVSAVMAAATFVLPSMTMDANAQQCASSASSVSGSAASSGSASQTAQQTRCDTNARADPPAPEEPAP
jgi:hypothetical protein